MLGLKRYKNYTLDLWVGKEEDFFCDLMVFFEEPSSKKREASETLTLKKETGLTDELQSNDRKNIRHLVFVCPPGLVSSSFLENLKTLLSLGTLQKNLKRVTLLTNSLEEHDKLQEEITKIF